MSIIVKGLKTVYASILLRKIMHLIFSLVLITLFTHRYKVFVKTLLGEVFDPTLVSLSILLFIAALVNSIQIRMPNLREKFLRISGDLRRRFIDGIETTAKGKPYAEVLEGFIKILARYEERFIELISIVERDYELKYGYISITFALLSVTMSYILFGYRAIYGILALAIVDSISAITTFYTSDRRGKLKHSIPSIVITYIIFMFILLILSRDITSSMTISAIAIITELLSPEDNLTLPIITSLTSYILSASLLII